MSESRTLIDLGDLSKPATVLIEKVSNAVGAIYEPRRIRKKADAEAYATKVAALATIEVTELEQRAIDRLVYQETRKQKNIEDITMLAAESLSADAKVDEIEEDWIASFFKKCDMVSDKEMQTLWANLLAGEAAKPNSYSLRTVEFVSTMDKRDAQLFTIFCQFNWFCQIYRSFVIDDNSEIFKRSGVDFSVIRHLTDIGLISYENAGSYGFSFSGESKLALRYFDKYVVLDFQLGREQVLNTGKVLLTKIGQELANICGAEKNEEFYEYLVKHWFDNGLNPMTPLYPVTT